MNAAEALKAAAEVMRAAQTAEPQAKAKVIVSHVLGVGLAEIASQGQITTQAANEISAMAQKCAGGMPVEYVTGRAYFRHLVLEVTPDVLIPRQESELTAQHAIDLVAALGYTKALDMCTGSGCIAISAATETSAHVDAADISEAALNIARRNAANNGADVRFFTSDMFEQVDTVYDIIVCNPPYIGETEYSSLDKSVRDYEPKLALTAQDGLTFYRIIAQEAAQYIHSGGALVLEIGIDQANDVAALLKGGGMQDIEVHQDYTGRDRIVTARK